MRHARLFILAGLGLMGLRLALAEADPTDTTTLTPVYLEDSPAAQELVDQAFHLRDQGRWVDAAAMMQQVIEQFPQKLMKVAGPRHEDAARWVRRVIAQDPQWLAAYREIYEPEAARQLALARAQGPDESHLARIVQHYLLCHAGLEATLDLAGLALERGAMDEARALLREAERHPDLEAARRRYLQLCHSSALMAGQPELAGRYQEALAGLGEPPWLSAEDDFPFEPKPLAMASVLNPQSFASPLWEVGLPDSPAQDNVVLLRRVPNVSGQKAFINAGAWLLALDRTSGRVLWTSQDFQEDLQQVPLGRFWHIQRMQADERGVAVWGDRLITVLGPDFQRVGRRQLIPSAAVLACVSAHDGQVIWKKHPADLDSSLEHAMFHGTPVVDHRRAYVLLRRSQMSGFHDAYVAAVDVATGKLMWRRHLSSAASGYRFAVRPFATMRLEDSRLYVCDNLGTVACLEARTGAILWSCLLGEAVSADGPSMTWNRQSEQAPGDPPVLVEAGLLIPAWTTGAPALVLDPVTGQVRRELSGEPWNKGGMLSAAGRDVLLSDLSVHCFDGRTLELRWVHESDDPPVAHPLTIGSSVIVPRRNRLVVLDLPSGRLLADLPSPGATGLAVVEDQVIVTTANSVVSYMPWDRAYRYLTERMREESDLPSAGLALAHIAASQGRHQAMLEGIDHVVKVLQTHPSDAPVHADKTRDVFVQLLAFADGREVKDPAWRREVFRRIGPVATTAAEEVALRMSMAEFEAQSGQIQAAVDQYQSILADETLSRQLYQDSSAIRQAWMQARQALAGLIAEHGQAVYERYESAAVVRFEQIMVNGGGDPQLLQQLAQQYPLASVSSRALGEAARQFIRMGQVERAIVLLRRAYRQAPNPEAAARFAGGLAQAAMSMDRPRLARRWLNTFSRAYPGVLPVFDGQSMSMDTWLASVAATSPRASDAPTWRLPIQGARLIPGQVLSPWSETVEASSTDYILIQDGPTIQRRDGADLRVIWSMRLPDDAVRQLLWADQEQVVLWSTASSTLVTLSADSGQRLREDVDVASLLDFKISKRELERSAGSQSGLLRDMLDQPVLVRQGGVIRVVQPGIETPLDPRRLVAANEWYIVFADVQGGVVCLDRREGQVLWRLASPMHQVSSLHLRDDVLVISGITEPGTDAQAGLVLVLDAETGEKRFMPLELRESPTYVGVDDSRLFVAIGNEVSAHQLTDGLLAWRTAMEEHPLASEGWLIGDALWLRESGQSGGLAIVDAETGQLRRRVPPAELGPGRPVMVQTLDGQWYLNAPSLVARLGQQGQVLWRDAAVLHDARYQAAWITEQHVVALAQMGTVEPAAARARLRLGGMGLAEQVLIDRVQADLEGLIAEGHGQPPASRQAHYIICVFEREGGRMVAEYVLGPLVDLNPISSRLLPGRLVIAAGRQSLVIEAGP